MAVYREKDQQTDLIEVRTPDGLIGYGEGAWCEDLLRRKPELVVGRSAFEVESIFEDLASSGETPGGLDIALWDLLGKALEMPVSRVLGKVYRSRVQVRSALRETQSAPIAAGLSLPLDALVRDVDLVGGTITIDPDYTRVQVDVGFYIGAPVAEPMDASFTILGALRATAASITAFSLRMSRVCVSVRAT